MDILPTLDELVSSAMLETPSYQLPDGEVVYLREEYWIKPLVNVSECEFVKDMFGLVWKPSEVAGWTEIDGVYILDEYIEETITEYAEATHTVDMTCLGPLPAFMWDSLIRVMNMNDAGIEWRMFEPSSWRIGWRMPDCSPVDGRDFWTSSLPDDTDDFPEAVCPICGETTCDHYDDHEPMFKSCQTIGC